MKQLYQTEVFDYEHKDSTNGENINFTLNKTEKSTDRQIKHQYHWYWLIILILLCSGTFIFSYHCYLMIDKGRESQKIK